MTPTETLDCNQGAGRDHGRTHLDLFSGIGGFAIAAQNCGYQTIGFCEKEHYAQQILKERFGAVLADAETAGLERRSKQQSQLEPKYRLGKGGASAPRIHPDIFTINGADYAGIDLLTGGFPCQPFSVAGKRRGAEDDRAIWPEMLRVIDGAKPAWLIGENVAGIVTMELDNILSDLEGIGYTAWPLVIPACAVDARHRRDRVWIVAHADEEGSQKRELRRGICRGTQPPVQGENAAMDGEDVAHAANERLQRAELRGSIGQESDDDKQPFATDYCGWLPEPELGRVAHGIPHRAHRLRGLGNAIVPQVAEMILRAIA
jgi:DNA (cytosine-5)-methyltransferase 1